MRRIFALAILTLAGLSSGVFTGCSTSPTGRKQLLLISDGEMSNMGAQAFGEMKKKTPIEKDPRINAYVQCIANAVAKEAKDSTGVRSWEVVVFKDNTANAFALPGGKIGVHTGILPVAKTADQLAAVLGHEVGHVIARHGGERMSHALAAQTGLIIAGTVLGEKPEKERNLILGALGLGAQFGVLMPFGRKQESESDEIGLILMAQAGFDPRQSVELWKNMAKAGGGKSPPEFLSTHPSHSTRIKDLQSNMSRALAVYAKSQKLGKNPNCGSL